MSKNQENLSDCSATSNNQVLGSTPDAVELPSSAFTAIGASMIWLSYNRTDGYAYLDTPAIGDTWTCYATLSPGQYVFQAPFACSNNCGIVDLVIDGVVYASFDTYHQSGTEYKNPPFGGPFARYTVPTSKRYKFELVVSGKNVASSDYYLLWRSLNIIKT
jgi:hypothetical protein